MKKLGTIVVLIVLIGLPQACRLNDDIRPDESPWRYGDPAKQGFDESLLLDLDSLLSANRLGPVSSMLVIRDGQLIFENYYGLRARDSLQRIGSMGNVVISLLMGLGIQDGYFESVDDPIYEYLGSYQPFFQDNELKKQIRFRDILTMKSGLSWNEGLTGINSPSNDAVMVTTQPDMVEFLLSKQMESVPGQRYSQNSAAGLLIVKALEEASGLSIDDYINQRLFAPLEILDWEVEKDAKGLSNISLGLSLRPFDLIKIGYLTLEGGEWEGKQIVGNSWLEESTTVKHRISSFLDVGYFWWRFSDDSSWMVYFPENKTFYGLSDDDQYLFVLPEYNMVFVLTTTGRANNTTNLGYYILSNYLLQTLQLSEAN